MPSDPPRQACQHAVCNCTAMSGDKYCSEHCRKAAQGGSIREAALARCGCGHAGCVGADSPAGRLLGETGSR